MKQVFYSLVLAAALCGVAYYHYGVVPTKDKEIDSLLSEVSELKKRIKTLSSEKEVVVVEREVIKEVEVPVRVEIPVEPKVEETKAAELPEDYTEKLEIYKTKRQEYLVEIAAIQKQIKKIQNTEPDFQEYSFKNGRKSGIRTSDSDRQKWYEDRKYKIDNLQEDIEKLNFQLEQLEFYWQGYLDENPNL